MFKWKFSFSQQIHESDLKPISPGSFLVIFILKQILRKHTNSKEYRFVFYVKENIIFALKYDEQKVNLLEVMILFFWKQNGNQSRKSVFLFLKQMPRRFKAQTQCWNEHLKSTLIEAKQIYLLFYGHVDHVFGKWWVICDNWFILPLDNVSISKLVLSHFKNDFSIRIFFPYLLLWGC